MSKRNKDLTAHNLKQVLWKTLNEVRERKMDTATANAVAQTAREIMSVVNAEIRIASMSGGAPPDFAMLEGKKK